MINYIFIISVIFVCNIMKANKNPKFLTDYNTNQIIIDNNKIIAAERKIIGRSEYGLDTFEGRVREYDISNDKNSLLLDSSNRSITWICKSDENTIAALKSTDPTILVDKIALIDINSRKVINESVEPLPIKRLHSITDQYIASEGCNDAVKIWDVRNFKKAVQEFNTQKKERNTNILKVSDDKLLLFSIKSTNSFEVWHVKLLDLKKNISIDVSDKVLCEGDFLSGIICCELLNSGQIIKTLGTEKEIYIDDLDVNKLTLTPSKILYKPKLDILTENYTVSFAENNNVIAAYSWVNIVALFDKTTGELQKSLTFDQKKYDSGQVFAFLGNNGILGTAKGLVMVPDITES